MTQSAVWHSKSNLKFPWLLGFENDLLYLLCPNLLAFAVYSYALFKPEFMDAAAPIITFTYAGNVIHQAATWFHYLDKRNRDYYTNTPKQKFKFIVAPVLILVCAILGGMFCAPVVALIYILWSVPHFIQQNVGILLLYHNNKTGEAIVDRKLEIRTQHLSGLFFLLLVWHRMVLVHTPAATLSLGVLGIVLLLVIGHCFAYTWSLFSQVRQGATLNVPALLFWFISVTFFLPFAYVGSNDFAVSFMVPSLLHWWQYIGLNYIMVKRKYDAEQSSHLLWHQPLKLFFGFAALIVLFQYGSYLFFHYQMPQPEYAKVWNCAFLGLGMVHYLLDGFIWKFREPFNRQAMLPYLVHRD
jgi:hypothetical protein